METQAQNINVVRSVWRRRIKKDIKLLDLTPVKDAKGGGIPEQVTSTLDQVKFPRKSLVANRYRA